MIDKQFSWLPNNRHQKIKVSTDGTAGPYILVGADQEAEVTDLLSKHQHRNYKGAGTSGFSIIELGGGAEVDEIQKLLDGAP